MNKSQTFILLLLLCCFFTYSQINITKDVAREINEQVFDTDHILSGSISTSNKRFEPLHGPIEEVVILYSDSLKVVNTYNKVGSLVNSKSFKKGKLRSEYLYKYKEDGKTLINERGVHNLDYTVYKKNEYLTKYFAVKATEKQKGFKYRYLDTLFINETKYSYEYTRQSNSKSNSVYEYHNKIKYNNLGYLKQIQKFKNDIQVGHLINFYNDENQVEKLELFLNYSWFYDDSGLPEIRNHIYKFEYDNSDLIKIINKRRYNPIIHEWETSITNYKSETSKSDDLLIANFTADSGSNIIIKIDDFGNWIYKSESDGNTTETTKRTLKYFQ